MGGKALWQEPTGCVCVCVWGGGGRCMVSRRSGGGKQWSRLMIRSLIVMAPTARPPGPAEVPSRGNQFAWKRVSRGCKSPRRRQCQRVDEKEECQWEGKRERERERQREIEK